MIGKAQGEVEVRGPGINSLPNQPGRTNGFSNLLHYFFYKIKISQNVRNMDN